jgi:hypothetical protein
MSQTTATPTVASLPLELGGTLRILTEDVDLKRGAVRWNLHGPHIRGVVWLSGEGPYNLDDPDDPGNFRCRMYSGDATGHQGRHGDEIRTDQLTCYRVPASAYRLGWSPAHLPDMLTDPIPPHDDWTITAAARRVIDIRHTLARHALAAPWLPALEDTWRAQTAMKIAARATDYRAKALTEIRAARARIRYAQGLLDAVAAKVASAEAAGIRMRAPYGRDLFGPEAQMATDPA